MPIRELNVSLSPTENVRSVFASLVENPVSTLMRINPNRKGFVSTMGRKSFREFTGEEKRAAVRIALSSFSSDDLQRASKELLDGVAMGNDDDYRLHLLVEGETKRRIEEKGKFRG